MHFDSHDAGFRFNLSEISGLIYADVASSCGVIRVHPIRWYPLVKTNGRIKDLKWGVTSLRGGEMSFIDRDGDPWPADFRNVPRLLAVVLGTAALGACAQSVSNKSSLHASARQTSFAAVHMHRRSPLARHEIVTKNYGLASFYDEDTETANGEKFDPQAMTAAHPSLPFGTRLRVTNVATGHSVTVRVNDRGPHVQGRVVDLSRSAAETLVLLNRALRRSDLKSSASSTFRDRRSGARRIGGCRAGGTFPTRVPFDRARRRRGIVSFPQTRSCGPAAFSILKTPVERRDIDDHTLGIEPRGEAVETDLLRGDLIRHAVVEMPARLRCNVFEIRLQLANGRLFSDRPVARYEDVDVEAQNVIAGPDPVSDRARPDHRMTADEQ